MIVVTMQARLTNGLHTPLGPNGKRRGCEAQFLHIPFNFSDNQSSLMYMCIIVSMITMNTDRIEPLNLSRPVVQFVITCKRVEILWRRVCHVSHS